MSRPALIVLAILSLACEKPPGIGASACRIDLPGLPRLERVPGSAVIVVLSDTQYYVRAYPDLLDAQADWIVHNVNALGIRFVVHLGDVTWRNDDREWRLARASLARVADAVPFGVAVGNHDLGDNADSRQTFLNEYLPAGDALGTFGGFFSDEPGRRENSYYLVTVGGRDLLLLVLEFGPRDVVVEWASRVLGNHAGRDAIVVTHAYLDRDGTRLDWKTHPDRDGLNPNAYGVGADPGGCNDGEALWSKLIARHSNVILVLSAHIPGVGRAASRGRGGNVVYELLSNYQSCPLGGEGYLRLLEFLPDGRTLQVTSYSPHVDRWLTDRANQFRIELQHQHVAHGGEERRIDG